MEVELFEPTLVCTSMPQCGSLVTLLKQVTLRQNMATYKVEGEGERAKPKAP